MNIHKLYDDDDLIHYYWFLWNCNAAILWNDGSKTLIRDFKTKEEGYSQLRKADNENATVSWEEGYFDYYYNLQK